jgi:hypothetical protein
MQTPNLLLMGRTPAELIREGEEAPVRDLLRSVPASVPSLKFA